MTPGSESQTPEAARPMTIISTRTTITIGAWNVRTMFETRKTAQVAAEVRNYNHIILGISESRWTGSVRTEEARHRSCCCSQGMRKKMRRAPRESP